MKHKIYFYSGLLCLVLTLWSCSAKSNEEVMSTLDFAEQMAADGDFKKALEMCDEVTQSKDTLNFTWKEYCRAAVIYAMAYDHDVDTDVSMASAAKCIERARLMQPDSVVRFLVSLTPDNAARVNTVVQTLDALYTDHSTLGDHEEEAYVAREEDNSDHPHED